MIDRISQEGIVRFSKADWEQAILALPRNEEGRVGVHSLYELKTMILAPFQEASGRTDLDWNYAEIEAECKVGQLIIDYDETRMDSAALCDVLVLSKATATFSYEMFSDDYFFYVVQDWTPKSLVDQVEVKFIEDQDLEDDFDISDWDDDEWEPGEESARCLGMNALIERVEKVYPTLS